MSTPSPQPSSESGAALVLLLILGAGIAAALTSAIPTIDPRVRNRAADHLVAQRLDATTDALRRHFRRNGRFPARLSDLIGQGRVSETTLADPYRPVGQLRYRFTSRRPDVVTVYSSGPNRRNDRAENDDIARSVSGVLVGRGVTRERLRLLRRAVDTNARSWAVTQIPAPTSPGSAYLAQFSGGRPLRGLTTALQLSVAMRRDGWDKEMRLDNSGSPATITSAGPDRRFNTADDVILLFP